MLRYQLSPPRKPDFLVGLGENAEIGFVEPNRQRSLWRDVAEENLAGFDEQVAWAFRKSAAEQGFHGQAEIALELGFGDARASENTASRNC
jgi:hypothetical protein